MAKEYSYSWIENLDENLYETIEKQCDSRKYTVPLLQNVSKTLEITIKRTKNELCTAIGSKFKVLRNNISDLSPQEKEIVIEEIADYLQSYYNFITKKPGYLTPSKVPKKPDAMFGKLIPKKPQSSKSSTPTIPEKREEEKKQDQDEEDSLEIKQLKVLYPFLLTDFYIRKNRIISKGKDDFKTLLLKQGVDATGSDKLFDKENDLAVKISPKFMAGRISFITKNLEKISTKPVSRARTPSPVRPITPVKVKTPIKQPTPPRARTPSPVRVLPQVNKAKQSLIEYLQSKGEDVSSELDIDELVTLMINLSVKSEKAQSNKISDLEMKINDLSDLFSKMQVKEKEEEKEPQREESVELCHTIQDYGRVDNVETIEKDLSCDNGRVCNIDTGICQYVKPDDKVTEIQIGKRSVKVTGSDDSLLQLEREVKKTLLKLSVGSSLSLSKPLTSEEVREVLPPAPKRVTNSQIVNIDTLLNTLEARTVPYQTVNQQMVGKAETNIRKKIQECLSKK